MKANLKSADKAGATPGGSLSAREYELAETMATTALAEAPPVPEAREPAEGSLERRITRGVTGSFLVSVITLPFGYLLSLILARVSPEAVGIYSVLGIYLSVVSTVLYFGGGTVTIRFMAELPGHRRMPFFLSYLLLTLGVATLALAASSVFPGLAQSLFGAKVSFRLLQLLLLLSPIPLFFFATLAALRGILQVTLAQALMRSVTLVSCLFYGYLLVFHKSLLQHEYTKLIVISYFALMLAASLWGFRTLWKKMAPAARTAGWFLPNDFWSFALAVQVPSMLALMQQKMDEIFLLWALGLAQLGIYFVLAQLAGASELLANFFLEGVFPAILSLQAAGKPDKTVALYTQAGKYVLLISASTIFFLIAFAEPLLRFLGSRYLENHPSFLLLLCFAAVDSLGPLNHTLIVGLKKMRSWTVVQSVRLIAFVVFFLLLASALGLFGVVLARGSAWLLAGAIGYWIVLNRVPIRVRVPRQYFLYVALSLSLAAVCYFARGTVSGWLWSAALFLVPLALFLFLGGYRMSEFSSLGSAWAWRKSNA